MRCALVLLMSCLALPIGPLAAGVAQAKERSAPVEFGLGISALLCTVVYGSVKTVYAVGGTLTGSLAWVLTGGRGDVFHAIVQPAVRGDYVVVPENLTFEEPLVFAGKDPKRSEFTR